MAAKDRGDATQFHSLTTDNCRYNVGMHRPSRASRILKWTGAGLSAVIMAAWVANSWIDAVFIWRGNKPSIAWLFVHGNVSALFANFDVTAFELSTGIETHPWRGLSLEWPTVVNRGDYGLATVPCWLLLLLTAICFDRGHG